jgi:enterochelin esterase family protein
VKRGKPSVSEEANELVLVPTSPVEQMRNWVAANTRMAAALKAKGYPHQFVFHKRPGHVERSVEMQTMPEAFEWVWKGYKPRKD